MVGLVTLVSGLLALASAVTALKNPIIPGWNPDPHVLRVDDTYYIAVSSFLTDPGVPIYKSKDLANWELISHALEGSHSVPLHGIRQNNGVWAPSLTHIDGLFYMTTMVMWGSDPSYRTWPRFFWVSSPDLKTWSDVVWGEPIGIDPHLWQDPNTGKNYLHGMGLDNIYDQVWGINQCEVDLVTGKCVGPWFRTWNGSLPVSASGRPEGPKIFFKDDYYYLIAAEGGTGGNHRLTIGRSESVEGPWESSPTNPLLFHGDDTSLAVGNTGHGTFATTPDGKWFCTFLARRYVDNWSILGRETFFAPVEWTEDGWPIVNNGERVLLSQSYEDYGPEIEYPKAPFEDRFEGTELRNDWYQLRTPYTQNYYLKKAGNPLARRDEVAASSNCTRGVVLVPNVFTLTDRDTPAALLRKQTSVNMTFSATLLSTDAPLGRNASVGITVYAFEGAHQEIGVRGCLGRSGQCIFVDSTVKAPGPGTPPKVQEVPVDFETIPKGLTLHVRIEPRRYRLGYSFQGDEDVTYVHQFSPGDIPVGFDGAMLGLYASGGGNPWPFDAPEVGFSRVREVYYDEGWGDYKADRP